MPSYARLTRRLLLVVSFPVIAGLPALAQGRPPTLVDPPMFKADIAEKKLPAIDKRLPAEPLVVKLDGPGQSIGRHGGMMNQLMERAQDIRRMSAYGYSRLIGYDASYRIVPDILKSLDVKDEREFTLTLRKGHKWSDGKPFTTEDFRYYWQDIALNAELTPEGPPKEMMVDGKPPVVEVVDEVTIRYRWDRPNPAFLPVLAAATPLNIYRPSHYLKRYHKAHAKADRLAAEISKRKRKDWVDLHFNRDRMHRLDNPDFPVLDPWRNTTPSPADRYIFERNPYFHRIDAAGRQLPYVDRVAITIASGKLIPAKVGAGEAELQSRSLQFNNYTTLKRAEARHGYNVRLWRAGKGSQMALYPNLNAADPVWRKLMRDVRFRRALSLAIDRREINQVIYYGLARESANTMLAESPLYREERRLKWSGFDLKAANALLDEMGLKGRDGRNIRLLPDGRPLEIIVETAGEGTEHSDVLELIRDTWASAGVALFIKPQTREVMRRRASSGQAVMTVFSGLDSAIARADSVPYELAPTNEDQLNWPQWGMHHTSNGKMGQRPDLPEAARLSALYDKWLKAASTDERAAAWHEMLDIHADSVLTIGTVNAVPQPIVVSGRVRNVPEQAIYNWDPGAHFGIFRPDTFWLTDAPPTGGS
jgi:peptide/nickel transport system substrate-binding protein